MVKRFENFDFEDFEEEENIPKKREEKGTKDEVERVLINKWTQIGMDIPDNHEDIIQYCYEDILDTADIDWHDGDVAIAFRRWIESQN